MSKKTYNVIATTRTALPRSKRLRELGVSGNVSSSGTVSVSGGSTSSGDGHSHDNKALLDSLSNDDDGYLYLRQVRNEEDEPSVEKVKAGYADVAHDLDSESPVMNRFIRKDQDDRTDYQLAVGGTLTAEADLNVAGKASVDGDAEVAGTVKANGGAEFGEFYRSLYAGKGAGVDADGNMEVESLRVRSYLEVMELIINRLTAIEGDQLLTEADTIESVDDLGDGCYGLHLKSKREGYFTAQKEGNVLKGIINSLSAGGAYYTAWMRVNSVNAAGNYIEVTAYPDDETPAGKNYPPSAMMNVARWGSQTDETRQSCLYLSSTEGRIVKLVNVTKPILEDANYGMVFGTIPEWLKNDVRIDPTRDYLYAMGVVCQNFVQVDYKGEPIPTYVDCGPFVSGTKYLCRDYDENGRYVIHDVWHMGCKWRCQKTGTTATPAWNSTDWAMVEGNPEFTVDFAEEEQLYDADNFHMTLTIVAKLYNMDVTDDILTDDVEWTRYSEDAEGNPRTASDNLWALNHAGAGKAISLDLEDLDVATSSGFPKKVRFTATVTLRDGAETTQAAVSMETI
jgi:hypothetical protein